MTWSILLSLMGVLGAWLGFIEKRLHDVQTRFEEKLESKNELNRVIQQDLKEDISRLENKIDMLINLQIRLPKE